MIIRQYSYMIKVRYNKDIYTFTVAPSKNIHNSEILPKVINCYHSDLQFLKMIKSQLKSKILKIKA